MWNKLKISANRDCADGAQSEQIQSIQSTERKKESDFERQNEGDFGENGFQTHSVSKYNAFWREIQFQTHSLSK